MTIIVVVATILVLAPSKRFEHPNCNLFQPSGSSAALQALRVPWLQVAGLAWSLLHGGRAREHTGGREETCSPLFSF